MELFTNKEIQAMLALLNRTPMSSAEILFAQSFFQRLSTFCKPPANDDLDEADKHFSGGE